MKTEEQCYATLGLSPGTSDEQVKSKFRELAKKYHPDMSPDPADKEKFIEIQQAYDSIVTKQFARNSPAPEDYSGNFDFSGFPGFGGFGFAPFHQVERQINTDKTFALTITFLEACLGTTKTIAYTHQTQCPTCEEYIKKNGRQEMDGCSVCGGSGSIQRTAPGIRISQTCQNCNGRGVILKCATCHGVGSVANKKQVSFKIESGVENDNILRLDGQADFNPKSKTYGDVYIKIKITPHATMTKNGMDIFSKLKVSYLDCILGASVEFETIHGIDTINLPPLTASGAVIKRSNAGINKSGSHILTIEVELPSNLNAAEKKLLNKIRNSKLKN